MYADAYSLPLEELTKEETEKILPSTIKRPVLYPLKKFPGQFILMRMKSLFGSIPETRIYILLYSR